MKPAKHPSPIGQALSDLESAHRAVLQAIEAVSDLDDAFEAASQATEQLQKMRDELADIRTRIVGEMWHRDQMSLGMLANRIGVSKTRAAELTRALKNQPARRTTP